nr:MAG TPA: Protein of unknown function (DUF4035) [Caudoviricetes sp.]
MAEAKQREAWNHTAALMAFAVNLMRDPKKGAPARPEDFHPFAPRPQKPILRGKDLRILKDVFVKTPLPRKEAPCR